MLKELLPRRWKVLLEGELSEEYFDRLDKFLEQEYDNFQIFPPKNQLFRALELCAPEEVRVVIVGQDPYHGDGQANGLSFSVASGVKIPPSLRNIYKALPEECGNASLRESGDLENWARQGVLMLNAVLSVRAHCPASHASKGWEKFTDAILKIVGENQSHVVYMLWGAYAQQKAKNVDKDKNLILESVHPSPLSAYKGWFDADHFGKANEYLGKFNRKIIW